MDLSQLVYISHAAPPPTAETLSAISEQSKNNNWQVGVTGLLLYSRGNYLQLLEGPLLEVAELYSRISRDPRHERVLPLLLQPATRRFFPEWKMGVLNLDEGSEEDRQRLPRLMRAVFEQKTSGPHAGVLALELVRGFMDRGTEPG